MKRKEARLLVEKFNRLYPVGSGFFWRLNEDILEYTFVKVRSPAYVTTEHITMRHSCEHHPICPIEAIDGAVSLEEPYTEVLTNIYKEIKL